MVEVVAVADLEMVIREVVTAQVVVVDMGVNTLQDVVLKLQVAYILL